MARVLSKKIGPVGSTGHVTLNMNDGAFNASVFDHVYGNNGENVRFQPGTITKLIVGSGNVTFDSIQFGAGTYDLFETPIAATTPTAGNYVVVMRGVWIAR